ncbi:hypothetical protein [Paraburkholderia bryophila]|uniref:Uncharacterized protein n=1 Tax=Paraburkholderia bryophila TaxID=420952 RepID=A0A7Y9WUZ4_9BURK|nr:hypothetical protein [Paraburkholderia bryophila]NYH26835.1 hypothetical protein [Paraburkholderia bryophila]
MNPILLSDFHHEGRGPELMKVHYRGASGRAIVAVDYFLSEDSYTPENLRHLRFFKPQVFMFTPEEVEPYTPEFNPWEGETRFAAVDFGKSAWLQRFSSRHLGNCSHYRFMFYDEFLDVICEGVEAGHGAYPC